MRYRYDTCICRSSGLFHTILGVRIFSSWLEIGHCQCSRVYHTTSKFLLDVLGDGTASILLVFCSSWLEMGHGGCCALLSLEKANFHLLLRMLSFCVLHRLFVYVCILLLGSRSSKSEHHIPTFTMLVEKPALHSFLA
jgi:hypothetical protein